VASLGESDQVAAAALANGIGRCLMDVSLIRFLSCGRISLVVASGESPIERFIGEERHHCGHAGDGSFSGCAINLSSNRSALFPLSNFPIKPKMENAKRYDSAVSPIIGHRAPFNYYRSVFSRICVMRIAAFHSLSQNAATDSCSCDGNYIENDLRASKRRVIKRLCGN